MKKLLLIAALSSLTLCAAAFGQHSGGGKSTAHKVPEGFVWVEGGTFQMGDNNGDSDEKPVHGVTVKSFYMGKYPVMQKEWQKVMGTNPSHFKGDNLPVENVNWYEAVEYCNKLSLKEGLTPAYQGSEDSITYDRNANGYRLPTEAEWEYAAKGGNGSPGNYTYSGSSDVGAVAWYTKNSGGSPTKAPNNVHSGVWYERLSGGSTQPVGTKAPNNLGLYDMSGNVWEWCWDWFGFYGDGSQTDPVVASSGAFRSASSQSFRIKRGGGWKSSAAEVSSTYRGNYSPHVRNKDLGFRLVRPYIEQR